MKQLNQPGDLANGNRGVCLAIGMFDGVHLGHQQVLRQAVNDAARHEALAVAVTFDQHPANVVAPNRAPALLQTKPQRLRAIETTGIDAALVIRFDTAFSQKPGETFVRELFDGFGSIHSICTVENVSVSRKSKRNTNRTCFAVS